MTTGPDLLLPEPIKVFDHRLETRLQRRREDRRDTERQTKTHHSSDDVGMVMASLEAHIVVELCEGRQTVPPPMSAQGIKDKRSGSHLRWPGRDGRPPKRSCGEDLEQPKTFHPQVFDHVKGVDLRPLLRRNGQIPARRRRGAANPLAAVEQTVASENAPDRPEARHGAEVRLAAERFLNGLRTDKAEGAISGELTAHGTDGSFQDGRGLVGDLSGSVGTSAPIHARQRIFASPFHPTLDRAQSHPETPRPLPP